MSQSIELEGDEIRPTIELSAAEIAQLEQEKRELTGFASVVRRSDGGRIRGEGTALDPEPAVNVVSIRTRLESQRAAAGEPIEAPIIPPQPVERKRLTVDPLVLSRLAAAAQQTADESAAADELAESAGAAARFAREALDAYLAESGLAG